MGRHSSATPPDAQPPTRPDSEQDRGDLGVPVFAPVDHQAPPDLGASPTLAEAAPPREAVLVDRVPEPGPADPAPEAGPAGWPERLADSPFGWASANPGAPSRREDPPQPTGTVHQRAEPVPAEPAPTEIEQAEEEHLDWLRHLPESREQAPAEQHPPAHGRAEPPPQRESPRREWTERLVVGLIAGLVTLAATRWAGAAWSTAALIGATVLVVVPTAAWVSTLGHRSSAPRRPDGQPDRQAEH